MTFEELPELHNITPIENLRSILQRGILSHWEARKVEHSSVAMAEIQDIRKNVVLPGGRSLHSCANLYFNARNAMMFKRRAHHRQLCVVRIDKAILSMPSVIIADQNACSSYARFAPGLDGLRLVSKETVFAKSWIHVGDDIATWRHKAAMCAEVLVPDRVPPEYLRSVYVSSEEPAEVVQACCPNVEVLVNGDLFFV